MSEIPEEIRRLAVERAERRDAKDYAAADRIRDRLAELGFRVVDTPDGPSIEPLEREDVARPLEAEAVPSVLDEPATVDASVQWVVEGWPEDVARAIAAFRATAGERTVQYLVADVVGSDPSVFGDGVEVLSLAEGTGWAAARNAGLRRSRGRIVLAMDGSVEPTGDIIGPIERALQDETVGVCGPFGIVSEDLRTFESSSGVGEGAEVDAVEGYLMAFRREVLERVGTFDEKFRWYRTADIEWSFRVKDAGLRAVVVEVPVRRHEHRMWAATPPDERDRLSKRNYYRFLDRFRGRTDLLVSPRTRD